MLCLNCVKDGEGSGKHPILQLSELRYISGNSIFLRGNRCQKGGYHMIL